MKTSSDSQMLSDYTISGCLHLKLYSFDLSGDPDVRATYNRGDQMRVPSNLLGLNSFDVLPISLPPLFHLIREQYVSVI